MRIPCWQAAVQFRFDIPLEPKHQTFMDKVWCAAESGADGSGGGRYNPLGTTLELPGSTPLAGNTAGVQNYRSRLDGVHAHIATLGATEYRPILTELRKGNPDYTRVCNLIGASRWGTDAGLLLRLCKQYGLE